MAPAHRAVPARGAGRRGAHRPPDGRAASTAPPRARSASASSPRAARATKRLAEALGRHRVHLILASSASVYGFGAGPPVGERAPCARPRTSWRWRCWAARRRPSRSPPTAPPSPRAPRPGDRAGRLLGAACGGCTPRASPGARRIRTPSIPAIAIDDAVARAGLARPRPPGRRADPCRGAGAAALGRPQGAAGGGGAAPAARGAAARRSCAAPSAPSPTSCTAASRSCRSACWRPASSSSAPTRSTACTPSWPSARRRPKPAARPAPLADRRRAATGGAAAAELDQPNAADTRVSRSLRARLPRTEEFRPMSRSRSTAQR